MHCVTDHTSTRRGPSSSGILRMCACICCLSGGMWLTAQSSFHAVPLCITVISLTWLSMIMFASRRFKTSCESGVRALVVLGSGGHTAEMMTMLSSLVQQNMRFRGILYALAATDRMSRFKAENSGIPGEFVVVPRAREVGQSYASSAFTTARAFVHSFMCVLRYQPQLLLCNGPGTCVPFAIAISMCRSECRFLMAPCYHSRRTGFSGCFIAPSFTWSRLLESSRYPCQVTLCTSWPTSLSFSGRVCVPPILAQCMPASCADPPHHNCKRARRFYW
jgi:hypothetical protein